MADKAPEKAATKKTATKRKTTRKKAPAKPKSRLDKLKELEIILQAQLLTAEDKTVASIARQYRETLKEIEQIEGNQGEEDEISKILSS